MATHCHDQPGSPNPLAPEEGSLPPALQPPFLVHSNNANGNASLMKHLGAYGTGSVPYGPLPRVSERNGETIVAAREGGQVDGVAALLAAGKCSKKVSFSGCSVNIDRLADGTLRWGAQVPFRLRC